MYCITHGNDEDALKLIDKVYDKSENREQILEKLKLQVQTKNQTKSSFVKSVFGRKYLKGTLVAMIYTMLCQQTGSNVFMMFSNRILTQINK